MYNIILPYYKTKLTHQDDEKKTSPSDDTSFEHLKQYWFVYVEYAS